MLRQQAGTKRARRVPGASILELDDWGIRPARWEELHLVSAWCQFMTEPAAYFHHLFTD